MRFISIQFFAKPQISAERILGLTFPPGGLEMTRILISLPINLIVLLYFSVAETN